MRIFKKTRLAPVPAKATFKSGKNGKATAHWTDGNGATRSAPVERAGGADKVRLEAEVWTCRYRDENGVLREVATGCRDRSAAEIVARDLRRKVERIRAGIVSPDEAAARDHAARPLADHLRDYEAHHQASSHSPEHVADTLARRRRVFDGCGAVKLGDLAPARVEKWLAEEARKNTRGARTRNLHRAALVHFGEWLGRNGRLPGANPFKPLPTANVNADRRHERRALTPAEAERLLLAARWRTLAERGRATEKREGRKRANWTYAPLTLDNLHECADRARAKLDASVAAALDAEGLERLLYYRTLLATGLRKSEGGNLFIKDCRLRDARPTIWLRPEYEKNRKGAIIPIPPNLAAELTAWLDARGTRRKGKGKRVMPTDERLFTVADGALKRFDRDLAVAGIAKADAQGKFVDLHALRMTFITWLSVAGVPLRTAQALARHSDPKLTAMIYTDPQLLDKAAAVETLPTLSPMIVPPPLRKAAGAEGMVDDGINENPGRSLPPFSPPPEGKTGAKTAFCGKSAGNEAAVVGKEKTAKKPVKGRVFGPITGLNNGGGYRGRTGGRLFGTRRKTWGSRRRAPAVGPAWGPGAFFSGPAYRAQPRAQA